MITKIITINDVLAFTKAVIEEGTNLHPDDDFQNYINTLTNEPAYTSEEAQFRNKLMYACFEVCEKEGVDIYDLVQEVFLKETGLDKYIPLPSSLSSNRQNFDN